MPICVGGFGRLETLIAVDINYMHSPAAEVYPVHRDSFVASLADTERRARQGGVVCIERFPACCASCLLLLLRPSEIVEAATAIKLKIQCHLAFLLE